MKKLRLSTQRPLYSIRYARLLSLVLTLLLLPLASRAATYDLYVNGTQVTDANKNAIIADYLIPGLGSSITFDGSHTLTLTNVSGVEFDSSVPFIQTGMDLTVSLVGKNEVNCGQYFAGSINNSWYDMTFTTNAADPGSLTIKATSDQGGDWNNMLMIHCESASGLTLSEYPFDQVYIYRKIEFSIPYNVYIGQYQVTNANKDNVDGQNRVSYNPATNTLTLNGYSNVSEDGGESFDPIYCYNDALTIKIAATSRVGQICWEGKQNPGTLHFTREANVDAELLIMGSKGDEQNGYPKSSAIQGFSSVTYDSNSSTYVEPAVPWGQSMPMGGNVDDTSWKVTVTPAAYPLWIGDTQATLLNSSCLATGWSEKQEPVTSLSYNHRTSTLTMNYYYGYEPIVAQMQSFNIYLMGTSNMYCMDSQNALVVGSANSNTLTFTTDKDNPGELTMRSSNTPITGTNLTINYENGLAKTELEGDGYTYRIGPLEAPSIGVNKTDAGMALWFEYDSNCQLRYSIDYADESLPDVEDEVYVFDPTTGANDPIVLGPCTITAYVKAGEITSKTKVAKLFGFAENPLNVQFSGIPEKINVPALLPAISPEDGITVSVYNAGNPEVVAVNDAGELYTSIGTGTEVAQFKMKVADEQSLPYQILNEYIDIDWNQEQVNAYIAELEINVERPESELVFYSEDYSSGVYITDNNYSDVFGDGTVSYDRESHKLTLNNASFGWANGAIDYTGDADLTIHLIGTNDVMGSESVVRYYSQKPSQNDAPQLIFTTDANQPGALRTACMYEQQLWNGFSKVSYPKDILALCTYGTDNYYALAKGYDLFIASGENVIQVTDANKDAIIISNRTAQGNPNVDLSFDPLTNTLTMNNYIGDAWDHDIITSGLSKLNVYLEGESSIDMSNNPSWIINSTNTSAELFFRTSTSEPGKLSITYQGEMPFYGFAKISYRDDLQFKADEYSYPNGATIYAPNDFGIVVYSDRYPNGQRITRENYRNVFGDAGSSVRYDGHRRLSLKNASLTGIYVQQTNLIDEKGLVIRLDGVSTITNADGAVCYYDATGEPAAGGAKMKLEFFTGSAGSKLIYNSTREEIVYQNAEEVFVGFDVNFGRLTAELYNNIPPTNTNPYVQYVTVALPLDPIVDKNDETQQGQTTEINYGTDGGEVTTENLTNIVIDNVLYTLVDDGTSAAPDGFDQTQKAVVLNSTVTPEELEAAMALQPGSKEYAQTFQGLTLLVPAGTGDITLNAWSDNGHVLCVKVGGQLPTVIPLTATPTDYTISYTCSEDSYVYIYLPAAVAANAAPLMMAMDGKHRIGPKSGISGGLKSVKANCRSAAEEAPESEMYKQLDTELLNDLLTANPLTPGGKLVINDLSITDLADNLFLKSSSSAPELSEAPAMKASRRAGTELAIREDIAYIDARNTSITGLEISREAGPFNGVPANIFIYLPAGNTVMPGTPNVVVGGLCDQILLDATKADKPFEAAADFSAGSAKLSLGKEMPAGFTTPVYLPFDVKDPDAYGRFYQFNMFYANNTAVNLKPTKTVKANTAYVFVNKQPIDGLEVSSVEVKAITSDTQTGLIGTYAPKLPASGMYTFQLLGKKFVKATTPVTPFLAYIQAAGGAAQLNVTWGGDVNNNGIINITDAVGVSNRIKNGASAGFDEVAGDVNGDGVINKSDAAAVAGIILGQ